MTQNPDIFEKQAHTYLAAIITSSDDAIISKDMHGNITSWNPSAERIFGYTAAEIVGKHISILIPPDNIQEETYILDQLKQGNRIDHFQTIRRAKDGHLVNISVTVSPIKDATGKIIGASKVARDITERIQTEKALREASAKKDEFLTNMSHELRTPMNAVIGLSNILDSLPDMPQQAKKYIKTLKLSADNMMDLVNDLLDFARIEAGSFEIEDVEFDLAEQVGKAVSVTSVKADEKGLGLFVTYSPDLSSNYYGDPLRIHQILMNLLSNAIKFTATGSVNVDISGHTDEKSDSTLVTIKVTDTGSGIAPEKLEAIFEKFTQADSSITRQYGGSGLGLAIAKACVEKMNGTIKTESRVGLGSVFTVTLPLKNSDKVSNVNHLSFITAKEKSRISKKILLVEDYEPNILVAGTLLEQFGYEYDVARNGLEAIKKFLDGEHKLILMDLQMGDMDGFEATRKIRTLEAERKMKRTPIIAMTAHVREQDQKQCADAGMDDFIPKPFNISDLSDKISQHLNSDDNSKMQDAEKNLQR